MTTTFVLKILRGHPGSQYWEEFELEKKSSYNIISALLDIQRHPINRNQEKVTPVVWESGCLEEVCGSCSMLINGRPRQACTALVNSLLEDGTTSTITPSITPSITLAPLSKFPLIRDLIVDRSRMFENLKQVSAWVEADESRDDGVGPKIAQEKQEAMYALSNCMTCGCCLEACPQVNPRSKFIGPAAIAQVNLFNMNPTGKLQKAKRLHVMMEEGGVASCGNAQNCEPVCPKHLPLLNAIASIGRDVTVQSIKDLFSLPERDD